MKKTIMICAFAILLLCLFLIPSQERSLQTAEPSRSPESSNHTRVTNPSTGIWNSQNELMSVEAYLKANQIENGGVALLDDSILIHLTEPFEDMIEAIQNHSRMPDKLVFKKVEFTLSELEHTQQMSQNNFAYLTKHASVSLMYTDIHSNRVVVYYEIDDEEHVRRILQSIDNPEAVTLINAKVEIIDQYQELINFSSISK